MNQERYYEVTTVGQPTRVVQAPSAAAAIRFVVAPTHKARNLNARDLAALVMSGTKIETAPAALNVAGEAS